MKSIVFLTLFVIISICSVKAQKVTKLYLKGKTEKAEMYCMKQTGEKQKRCYVELGDAYLNDNKMEKAVEFYLYAGHYDWFKDVGSKEEEFVLLNMLGNLMDVYNTIYQEMDNNDYSSYVKEVTVLRFKLQKVEKDNLEKVAKGIFDSSEEIGQYKAKIQELDAKRDSIPENVRAEGVFIITKEQKLRKDIAILLNQIGKKGGIWKDTAEGLINNSVIKIEMLEEE